MKNIIFKSFKLLVLFGLMSLSTQLFAQERMVKGTVTDASDNFGMPGVSIAVKGTTTGTSTDIDGNYSLTVPDGGVLIFSFVGYTSQEILVGDQTVINVSLVEETATLSEIVVTGYGVQQKKDVTGATATLKSEDFNKGSVISPSEMMQGRVAGVNITQNSGEPGSGATVRIRGAHSVRANQDPLYVVDGVPLDINNTVPRGTRDIGGIDANASKNPLNFLNPDDIESIDILKDASSTAIYGSRGANGVVFITTKKGKKGEGTLTYSTYGAMSNIRKKLDLLSAAEMRSFASANGFTLEDLGANTDWQDEIFRTAYTQNHNLAYGGGNENASYRASFSYMDQDGIVDKTNVEKLTGRLNYSQKLMDGRVNIASNLTATRTIDTRVPIAETGGFEGDVLLTALKLNPTFPVFKDGVYYQHSETVRNPVAMIDLTDDKMNTDRILGNIEATVKLMEGLTYKVNYGVDHSAITRKINLYKQLTYLGVDNGRADIVNVDMSNSLVENYFTYETKLADEHKFDFLLGHSYQKFDVQSHGISVAGFSIEDKKYTDNLGWGDLANARVESDHFKNELQSFFGRVNYNFKEKYLLTATFRADGSTKFGKNNKYGYFPSASFAWRMGEEDFIKNMDIFNNLKLRVGWGITGNQEIPNKISLLAVGTAAGGAYFDENGNLVPGIQFNRTPNPDIQWETTSQINVGVDFGILRGRLSGSIDFFSKETSDVLLETESLAPAPTSTVWLNVPDMKIKNTGLEVLINGLIMDQQDLKWDATLNLTTVKNEVTDLPVDRITTGRAGGPGLSGTNVQIIKSGYSIGTFWGRKFLGYDSNGINKYEKDAEGNDIEGDLGSALPKFTASLSSSLKYKDFDFSVFFNGVFGNKVYNNTANAIFHKNGLSKGQNAPVDVSKSNESSTNTPEFSSRFIEDGSFIRLSNATLGYTFDTSSVKWLSKFRVYVSGNNLFLITDYSGYDPEVSTDASDQDVPSLGMDYTGYPKARTFTFGVNLEF